MHDQQAFCCAVLAEIKLISVYLSGGLISHPLDIHHPNLTQHSILVNLGQTQSKVSSKCNFTYKSSFIKLPFSFYSSILEQLQSEL